MIDFLFLLAVRHYTRFGRCWCEINPRYICAWCDGVTEGALGTAMQDGLVEIDRTTKRYVLTVKGSETLDADLKAKGLLR